MSKRHFERPAASAVRRVDLRPLALVTAALLLALLVLMAVAGAPAGALGRESATGLAIGHTGHSARADALWEQARTAQRAHLFTRATALYDRARVLYLAAGANGRARACLTARQDMELIGLCYPYTRAGMLELLATRYPDSSAAQRAAWLDLPSTESLRWDGVTHYYEEVPINLAFRDIALFQTQTAMVAKYREICDTLKPYLAIAAATPAWQQYGDPKEYAFTQTLAVPRANLPANGDLDLWFPLPIEGGPQTAVEITDPTPAAFIRNPPSTASDIGLLAMRIPLQRLNGDLGVSFGVAFSHAAQYFKVDPARVGRYDTRSALYRQYTASHANTRITPAISRTARRIVGDEKNPYLAAKLLYDYVVHTVKYSYVPHLALYPRGEAESVYVHEHKYGDCGAQSIYFSALCRAAGIPARTPGGFQIFTGTPASHFWAELYLPNYGWIPVDPTAATLIDYVPDESAADRAVFHDFFFANQDDLRLTVQKDTDLPLVPRATGRIFVPMVVQMPAAWCDTMVEVPLIVIIDGWSFK